MKMRDLTEEELKLAPDWATHYDSDYMKAHPVKLCFFNDLQAVNVFKNGVVGEPYFNEVGISDSDRELPIRKAFNIAAYEFADLEVGQVGVNGGGIQLNMIDNSRPPIIHKRDVIAMAKYFKLTAKDLE